MSKYKISLVVPIYGVEKYIQKFAESALNQTYQNLQFVFVNDGCKDHSMDILKDVIEKKFSYRKTDIIIINKENEGLPIARKVGIEAAEGEYILFADSDDWLEQNAVEKIVTTAESTNADIVYFDLIKEYKNKRSVKKEKEYTEKTKELWIENIFNYTSYGYGVTKCFRKSLYIDNAIHTPKLGMHEDICLMSQIIFYANKIVQLPEVLYHYRKDNENAMCSQKRKKRHIESSRNLLDLYAHYMNNLQSSPIRKVAGGIVLRAGWHAIIHNYNLWSEFPWLNNAIQKSKLSCNYRTPLIFQFIVKAYALFSKK